MPRPRPPIRRRKAPRPPRWWRGRRLTAYGREAISVLVLMGTLFLRDRPALPVAKREEERPPEVWATNTRHIEEWYGFTSGDRSIPPRPFPGQQVPPCTQKQEREINGGCWLMFADPAPCGRGYFEHQGRCYQPVAVAPRIPTSLGE